MTEEIISFSQHDYEIVKREVLYQGFFCFVRYDLRTRMFSGDWTSVFQREVLEHRPAAAILPYDPVLDRVILIEQFRVGAISDPESPWLFEVVAGLYNQTEESPTHTAKREAEEEAGCKILDLYHICEYFVSPGCSGERLTLFCGRVDASDIGGIHGLSSEHEDIRAFSLPADDAYQLVQEGKIKTSPAIIALQWLQLNREWLRQLWQIK